LARLDRKRPARYHRVNQAEETNVTLAAAGPSREGIASNPAALAALLIALIAAATLAGAWFFQLVLDIRPCPLCLEQRYAYYLALPLAALVAFLLLATLANAWLGGYHAGVEWKFWPGPTDCSGPLVDFGKAGGLLEQLDKVKVVRCDEVQWRFLGLSLAGYNVLISLAMAAIALFGFVRSAKRT
jgi:disulfide bond formation protein DsbB